MKFLIKIISLIALLAAVAASAHTLAPSQAVDGTVQQMQARLDSSLLKIITSLKGDESEPARVVHALYQSFIRQTYSPSKPTQALQPLQQTLQQIDAIDNKTRLHQVVAQLQQQGVNSFYSKEVAPSLMHAQRYAIYLNEGGLNPIQLTCLQNHNQQLCSAYQHYLSTLLRLAGQTNPQPIMQQVFAFERQLAANYSDKNKENPARKVKDDVYLLNPNYFERTDALIAATPLDILKNYLLLRLLDSYAPYLSSDFARAHFDFYGRAALKVSAPSSLENRALQTSKILLDNALAKLYVDKQFNQAHKAQAETMVATLKNVMIDRVKQLSWMSAPTQQIAIDKIDKIKVLVGYPAQWQEYAGLTEVSANAALASNIQAIRRFNWQQQLHKLNQTTDQEDWHAPLLAVNGTYAYTSNTLQLSLGLLQAPALTNNAAQTWGALGWFIGHELMHAIDNQGRRFDAEGNRVNWWSKEDRKQFAARARAVETQYNNYTVQLNDGKTFAVHGGRTLNENLADIGGLQLALQAYQQTQAKPLPAEEKDQFLQAFRGFLQLQATDEWRQQQVLFDDHAPWEFRVQGAIEQLTYFD